MPDGGRRSTDVVVFYRVYAYDYMLTFTAPVQQ